MGTLQSLASDILPAVTGNPLTSIVTKTALEKNKNTEDSYNLQMQQAQNQAESQLKKLEEEKAEAEKERLRNLKSAIAKQKVSFGSSGVSSSGGSSQAVLKGFLNESEEEKEYQEKMDIIKKQAINDSLKNKQQQNLLELSQMESDNDFFKLFG